VLAGGALGLLNGDRAPQAVERDDGAGQGLLGVSRGHEDRDGRRACQEEFCCSHRGLPISTQDGKRRGKGLVPRCGAKGGREADFAIYFLLDGAPKRKQPLVDKDE